MTRFLSEDGLRYFYNQIKSKFAAASHNHSAGNITSGTLPIARGGTGATTAAQARENLGIKDIAVNGTDYIVETYQNGTEWYRVWASGWVEQGGRMDNANGAITLTFLKPFANTDYTVTLGNESEVHANYYASKIYYAKRTDQYAKKATGMTILHHSPYVYWRVEGQGA